MRARSNRVITLGAATLAAALAIAACDGEDRPGAIGDTSVAYSLPDSTRADALPSDSVASSLPGGDSLPAGTVNPTLTMITAADSAAGDSIFHRQGRCFTCHGAAGEGMATLGPALIDGEWLHGDGSVESIERIIASGVATPRAANIAMPAFEGQLSAEQIRSVTAYVYALSRPEAMQGDTTRVDSMSAPVP